MGVWFLDSSLIKVSNKKCKLVFGSMGNKETSFVSLTASVGRYCWSEVRTGIKNSPLFPLAQNLWWLILL